MPPKIVSLLPSATEIVYLLGLGDALQAVTHECDYPPEATRKPVITRSAIDHTGKSSREIDASIRAKLQAGLSIYQLDERLLADLDPDLILTQELCDVCAVSFDVVKQAARYLDGERRILSLEPVSLDGILETIRQVGLAAGVLERAEAAIAQLQERIARIRSQTATLASRPRVYCMEWLDPPFAAGHWVPEQVEIAGGYEGLGRRHAPSVPVRWEEIRAYDPEVLVLMPCGFDVPRVLAELPVVTALPGWEALTAVRTGRVWAVNGSAYFNRPGPRAVDGIEILAHIFHPTLFPNPPRPADARCLAAGPVATSAT